MNSRIKSSTKAETARAIMVQAHEHQTRWDGRPYSVHPENVVSILRSFGVTDEKIICAAYLHDVLEDTDVSEEYILGEFGNVVLGLVKELTFNKGTDDYYINKCRNLSSQAKIIKVADIISNITDKGVKSDHFIHKRISALQAMLNPQQFTHKQPMVSKQ